MKKRSAKKNYVYNLIYQITLLIVPIIVTPYISRVLLADGVGQYSFSYSIITYFTIFASLGFGYYAQREIAKYQDDKHEQSKIFWEINISRLISVVISIVVNLILILSGVYGKNTQLMSLMMINIVSIAFDISFLFQGNENFGEIVVRNVLIKIIGTVLIFVFVKEKSDLWIYCLLISLCFIISNLSLWPSIIGVIEKVKVSELHPLRHMPGTLKLFIPTIATSIYAVLDKSLIGVITNSDAENGYYEQAEKISKVAITLVTCIGNVMMPRNSYEMSVGHDENVKKNIYTICHFVWLLGIPLMFGIIAVAENLVPWFLGKNFEKSIVLLQLFSILIPIIGISNTLGIQYLLPKKEDSKFTICLIIGTVVNSLLNIFLIFKMKSVGAVIASIIAEISITISMLVCVKKELSIKEMFKTIFKPLIAGIFMFLVLLFIASKLESSLVNTFILIITGCSIYSLLVVILKDNLALYVLNYFVKKFLWFKNKNN